MSEEIKYEPVFGPQELFDGAPDDVDMIGHSGGHYKNTPNGILYCGGCTFTADELRNTGFIAMRRIIKTPVWTMEDKQAGRLPEVGALVNPFASNPVPFLGVDRKDHKLWVFQGGVGFVFSCLAARCEPVETQAEKAQRLRSEWVKHALDLYMSSPKNDVASMGDVYDALLSGELKAPGVE